MIAELLNVSPFDQKIQNLTELQMIWMVEYKMSKISTTTESTFANPEFDKEFEALKNGK